MRKNTSIVLWLILNIIAAPITQAEYLGTWDSCIYNLLDHPHTVALRLEIHDADTDLPIPDAYVTFKGVYQTESRTSRDSDGPRPAQHKEYEVNAKSDDNGIVILALGWHKEYPWHSGVDEIEMVQQIVVRKERYRAVTTETPFARFLEVGQEKGQSHQDPAVFKRYEEAWHSECARSDVRFCVLDLGADFSDYKNQRSRRPEFFDRIRQKEWGTTYLAPVNRLDRGEAPQSLCGSYLIYLLPVQLQRLNLNQAERISETPVYSKETPIVSPVVPTRTPSPAPISDVQWQRDFLTGLQWGMSYDEVVGTLNSNGQSIKIVNSYRYSSTNSKIDTAEIPGTLIYATFRVNQIKLTFANHKFIGITFTVASDRQADAFYAKANELFGKGLETSYEDESAKKTFRSPQPCYASVRYRARTYIESRAAYSWSVKQGRHLRYGFLELNDWRAKDRAFKRDHSSEAQQFEAMQREE